MATLDIFEHESGRAYSISNDETSIETWLDSQAGRLQLALEPTNRYHEAVTEVAYARGHEVYWIDPYRLSHYRAGLGRRAKVQLRQSLADMGNLQEDADALLEHCVRMIASSTARCWRRRKSSVGARHMRVMLKYLL